MSTASEFLDTVIEKAQEIFLADDETTHSGVQLTPDGGLDLTQAQDLRINIIPRPQPRAVE